MSRADLIPLSLLRDLAARMPDPIRPASFVDLAVYVLRTAPAPASTAPAPTTAPAAEAAPAPAITAPAANVAPAPVAIDKKGLPWTLEELQRARELLNGGKGPSEVARILGRPVAATQITIKRYGVRGTGPITVPGRPKGRFKKADPADAPAPARKAKAEAAKPATARKPKASTDTKVTSPAKAKADPKPPLAKPTPAVAPPAASKIAPAAPAASAPASTSASKHAPRPEPAPRDADSKQARIIAILKAAVAENQPGRQIRVLSHLLTLPRGSFTAADDLFLAEGLASRRALAEIADQLGCEPAAVTARWKAMLFPDLTDRHGHILLDGQTDLLRALRWLAGREDAT